MKPKTMKGKMKPSERIEQIKKTLKRCVDCGAHNPHDICYPSEADNLLRAIIMYLDENET